MSEMALVLTIGILAGFGLLLYGAFFQKNDAEKNADDANAKALEKFKLSAEEADNALSNINSVSSLIIEEIDIKYKELLFLYQMLEEKKKDLIEHANEQDANQEHDAYDDIRQDDMEKEYSYNSSGTGRFSAYKANLEIMEIGRKMDEIRRFPKLHNQEAIMELYSKGYDVTDIARELEIGKGEVKLILGLNKVGVSYE